MKICAHEITSIRIYVVLARLTPYPLAARLRSSCCAQCDGRFLTVWRLCVPEQASDEATAGSDHEGGDDMPTPTPT